ncbi:hypothetical protein FXN98_26605 [Klebsiella pneumoniae]|nr:hypothetical protein FXN98_26605 [Klebsiella pneumoniae]
MVCVVGRMRDLILQLSKSSIYSTKPLPAYIHRNTPRHKINETYTLPPDINSRAPVVKRRHALYPA